MHTMQQVTKDRSESTLTLGYPISPGHHTTKSCQSHQIPNGMYERYVLERAVLFLIEDSRARDLLLEGGMIVGTTTSRGRDSSFGVLEEVWQQ